MKIDEKNYIIRSAGKEYESENDGHNLEVDGHESEIDGHESEIDAHESEVDAHSLEVDAHGLEKDEYESENHRKGLDNHGNGEQYYSIPYKHKISRIVPVIPVGWVLLPKTSLTVHSVIF